MIAQTTCDITSPFAAGAPTQTAIKCTLKPDFRLPSPSERVAGGLAWTHVMELADAIDIRDGLTRSAGANAFTYADGDQVNIPDFSGSTYVVVYVERVPALPGQPAIKRVRLFRDTAIWPGP